MTHSSFYISYPSIHSGTDKSEISFISGTPNIDSVFYSGNDHSENAQCEESQCGELQSVNAHSQRRFFVTDATVASLDCMSSFVSKFDDGVYGSDYLLILGSGEKYKTIDSVLRIASTATEIGITRNDVFIGIGGGVICDITAFAASIYKRGTAVQLVPTTLLAMVDASIGGKTGCDLDNYKNSIGTFFPAQKLYYFPEFIQYLPENQFNSGLAEAFKTALLFDKELFEIFKNDSDKINARDSKLLEEIIRRCVAAKAKIVEQDFTEQNIRAYLNLGHTFGHALESVAGLGTVTHGYAVAWGIGRSVELAVKKDFCFEAFRDEVFDILALYGWETKALPSCIIGGGIGERLLAVMHKDKKNISEKIRIILLKGVGETVIQEFNDNDILSVFK